MLVPPSRAHVQICISLFRLLLERRQPRRPPRRRKAVFRRRRGRRELGCKSSGPRRTAPRKISPLRDGQDKIFAGHKKVRRSSERASERACGHRGRGHLRHLPSPPNHQDPDYKVRCHSEDTITRLFMSCVVLLVSTILKYISMSNIGIRNALSCIKPK